MKSRLISVTLFVALSFSAVVGVAKPHQSAVPQFHKIKNVTEKKAKFIGFIGELAQSANDDILKQRELLLTLHMQYHDGHALSRTQAAWLEGLAKEYRYGSFDVSSVSDWSQLMRRVDIVPASLVIAQAATESGWGGSRFARHGNNYFGQWCFRRGCGIVPKQRHSGQRHELQRFKSPKAAVKSYMRNLNTHRAYRQLRRSRHVLRSHHKKISGAVLAKGLIHYSDRGKAYIRSIQRIIRSNKLETVQNTVQS